MKKNIYITVLACLSLLSCNDFIEKDLRGKQDLDNYFATAEEGEEFVNGLYKNAFLHNDWYQMIAPRLNNEMATDDAWMGNTNQDASDQIPASQYLITPNRMGRISDIYKYRFENVAACNIAIARLPEAPISSSIRQRLLGEAQFLRAYNYLELVANFGDLPLVLEPIGTGSMNKTRIPKAEIYTAIENDLIEAARVLKGARDGRVSKWACNALLARAYLFQSKWEKAYAYADTVIQSGEYSVENTEFIDIWNVDKHNGTESILEAQTSTVSDKHLGNQMSTYSGARGESKDYFPSKDAKDVMDGWGWCMPTSDLENCYLSENDEVRRKATIARWNEPVYGDEVNNPTYFFELKYNKSGRVIRKYYIPVATRRILVDKRFNAPLNVPILRLAEMYLTKAEAAYHLNKPAEAMDNVDIIRARVGLPPKKGTVSGTAILRAVWKERRMELAFEGLRLYDIRRQIDPETNQPVIASIMGPNGSFVRYNTETSTDKYETTNKGELQDKGIHFDVKKHLIWPIPQSEIDRSNGVISQNPNY